MTALTRVTRGENPANSDKLNQIIDAWNGNTAGINQGNSPLSLTAVNDPINYAMALRNADAGGKGLICYAPDGVTPLLRVDKTNGVYASPDGTAAADRILTVGGTQTLTNKTLTSPHMTGPVVDSGGLTLTSGGLAFGTTNAVINGGTVSLNFNNNANSATNVTIPDGGGLTIARGNLAFTPTTSIINGGSTSLNFNNAANSATNLTLNDGGGIVIPRGLGAFAAGDKYLIVDASGNLHKSALGPAS